MALIETLETRRLLAALPVDVRSEWAVLIEPSAPSGTANHSLHAAIGDGAGHVYVGGYTDVPGWVQGGYDTVVEDIDGFVAKYDASGARLWSTYVGGVGPDLVSYLVAAPDGSVYVAGQTVLTGPEADWVQDGQAPTGRFLAHLSRDGLLISAHWLSIPFGVVSFADSSMYAYERPTAGADPTLVNRILHRELLSGEPEWSMELGTDGATITGIQVHDGGGVYVTLSTPDDDGSAPDATLLWISPAGETLWSVEFEDAGGRVKHLADDDGTVYVASNRLLNGSPEGSIAVSRVSAAGEVLWRTPLGNYGEGDIVGAMRLVRCAPGGVYLLQALGSDHTLVQVLSESGAVVSNTGFGARLGSAVTDDNGALYVTGYNAGLLIAGRFGAAGDEWIEEIGAIGAAPSLYLAGGVAILGADSDVFIVGAASVIWDFPGLLLENSSAAAFLMKYAQISGLPEQQVSHVEAFDAGNQVTITWQRTNDASSYEVWRATDDPATATKIATTRETSYIDTTAVDKALSYYWIRPVNNIGAGPMSEPASIRLFRVPAVPKNVQATAGLPNVITISWDPAAHATSYSLYIVENGATSVIATGISETSYTHYVGSAGATRTYIVQSWNGTRPSALSEPAVGRTMAVPAAPQGLTASENLTLRIVLTWEPSDGAESYEVLVTNPAGFTSKFIAAATTYEYVLASFQGTAIYEFRVLAKNAAGLSTSSSPVSGTVFGAPSAPTPEFASWSDAGILLRWNTIERATSYQIWRANWNLQDAVQLDTVDGSATEYLDASAQRGVHYSYWMRSAGGGGTSTFSQVAEGEIPAYPPAPMNVRATSNLVGAVRVTWDGSGSADSEIWRSPADDPSQATLIATVGWRDWEQFIDVNVPSSAVHYYFVRDRNAAGPGEFSQAAAGQALPPELIVIDADPAGGYVHITPTTAGKIAYIVNGVATAVYPSGVLGFVINGSSAADQIIVDDNMPPVTIYAGAGDDTITTGNGNDLIYGGDGNDMIASGTGNDTIYGNFGADTISAGLGNDVVYAGLGRDSVVGGDGDDTLLAGNGADVIRGGAGHDHIEGRGKADTLYGGAGNDTVLSGAGSDVLFGDDGDDVLYANAHTLFVDELNGGVGHDRYEADENDVLTEVEELLG